MDTKGNTLLNASIGAAVSTVLWLTGIGALVSPVLGGMVSGYLQKEGTGGGAKVGGIKGVIMIVPLVPISLVLGAVLSGVPLVGNLLTGSIMIFVIVVLVFEAGVGLLGGAIGGALGSTASNVASDDEISSEGGDIRGGSGSQSSDDSGGNIR